MKLRFGPYTVETSNDDKPLFPQDGITKAAIANYYRDVADLMLPHLENRCLTIRRFPEGIDKDGFFQQHRPAHFPDFVGSASLPTADGNKRIEHIIAGNAAALVYLADQAAIELHGWLSTASQPRNPDRIVFDLDPADEDFESVVDCARLLKTLLELANLVPYVMTTGSRGLHVVAPLAGELDFDEIRALAKRLARAAARRQPARFTTEPRKQARQERLYIDIARNAYGQTGILPYSLRARTTAPVATPLDWDELGRKDLSPRRWTIGNLARRMAQRTDPFEDFFRRKRTPALSQDRLDEWLAETG